MRSSRSASASGLYGRRWRTARAFFLANNPYCTMCKEEGRVGLATEVDHIKKHGGDPVLFWDDANWQALCATHHRSAKARQERSGKVVGHDANGNPLDKRAYWQ